jgi:hypothetical protein
MKVYAFRFAAWSLPLIFLSGCATTVAFRPQGVSDEQIVLNAQEMKSSCAKLRQGTMITVRFYEGIQGPDGAAYTGTRTGYFYGCNRLSESLAMSEYPLTIFDRGEPYPIKYIAEVAVVPEASRVIVKRPVKKSYDWQRHLLTQ